MSAIAMKEIKFRAWSKASGNMTGWDVLCGLHASTFLGKQGDTLVVMQYVGMKDKAVSKSMRAIL